MKTTKYIYISALTLTLGLCGCNDNAFLTEKANTVYTTDNSYETVDQVKASITNMYVHIRYWYQIDKFMKGLGADVMDTPYFRSSGYGYSYFSNWSASSNSASKIYDAMYQLANYANQSLVGYNTDGLTWDSTDDKNEDYGQIMFLRGYAYLTLGELFGGVPLVDQFYETLKLDFTRSSREETYLFAINDLEAAAATLPDYPSEAGRVAKGAACHFLAEAYLALATINDNDATYLAKSIAYADTVISMHPLMTERFGTRASSSGGTTKNDIAAYYPDGNVFFDLFQEGNYDYSEGNTEAIWTLQNDYTVYLTYGGNNYVNTPREMSPVLRDVIWNSTYTESNAKSGPWAGNIDTDLYLGGNVCAYFGGRGVGVISPTTYVISDVWDSTYSDDMRNDPCNIRRYFLCTDTVHSLYGDTVDYDMLDYTSQKITEFFPIWTKFAPIDDWGYDDLSDGGNRSNIYSDQYACRSAETILLRAEAYFRAGNTTAAVADINLLRNRANCSLLCTTDDISLQYILDERVRELYGEERRWVTLLRMGSDGITSINNHAMYIATQSFWGGYFLPTGSEITDWTLFPIPQTVIDTNTGAVIDQNAGW
ncbi:MAG: RagB/SusD family nutrient uptake outer membrane protein [Bacteroidetes bacterium]|nr:RagB/SusD family nutrient uptake outer membrane protein [Bacteroidota bacterium]